MAGRASIGARLGGQQDLILDGKTGWLAQECKFYGPFNSRSKPRSNKIRKAGESVDTQNAFRAISV